MVVDLDIIGWSCKTTRILLLQQIYIVLYYRTVEAFKTVEPLLVSQLYQLYR